MFYSWLSIETVIVNLKKSLKKFLDLDRDLHGHQNLIDRSLAMHQPSKKFHPKTCLKICESGLRSGSGNNRLGLYPKSNQLLFGPCPTPPENFIKIC